MENIFVITFGEYFFFSIFYVLIIFVCLSFILFVLFLGLIGVTQALCPKGYVYELGDCHPLKTGKGLIDI